MDENRTGSRTFWCATTREMAGGVFSIHRSTSCFLLFFSCSVVRSSVRSFAGRGGFLLSSNTGPRSLNSTAFLFVSYRSQCSLPLSFSPDPFHRSIRDTQAASPFPLLSSPPNYLLRHTKLPPLCLLDPQPNVRDLDIVARLGVHADHLVVFVCLGSL